MKKPENRKINILGVEYDMLYKHRDEDKLLENLAGYCDITSKDIIIEIPKNKKEYSVKNIKHSIKKTERHEILHALFYESGLTNYYDDEVLVDLLAVQLPKIIKEMK